MATLNENNKHFKNNESTSRRSGRIKAKTVKSQAVLEPIKDSNSETSEDEIVEKPTALNDVKVSGGIIFGFQTPKRRDGLHKKVSEAINTQPKEYEKNKATDSKTPYNVRRRLKREISNYVKEGCSSSEHDFSDSGSEFEGSESSETEGSSDDQPTPVVIKKNNLYKQGTTPGAKKNLKSARAQKYVIKTDDYFSNQSSKKIVTSNHTLDKLDTPRLPQDQLQKLLKKVQLNDAHQEAVNALEEANKADFNKWLYVLHENFNILLYGLGSKRNIMHQFQQDYLSSCPVIVVNGFFPSLTIKDIVDGILGDVLSMKEHPSNIYEACDLIKEQFLRIPETHLYLIVHNIDGAMLRNSKSQNVLSRLASVKNVHLIASIDHINAPLIWDHNKLSNFNFIWWDITSYSPYTEETSFESSMMVQKSGSLALSSLRNVFLSLTSNSKGIYLIIVKYQLKNNKSSHYQGILFKDLYWSCREAFLVSSDLALRAQLTEFVDHKMVKFRRSIDGGEYLIVPIINTLLQQFLDEHSK